MLDPSPILRKVTFRLSQGLQYTFDINDTTTVGDMKRLLVIAAHLIKRSFRIFAVHDDKEYTDYDEDRMKALFPNMTEVIFRVDIDEMSKGLAASEMQLPDNEFCPRHKYKYMTFYCYDCKMSLCLDCLGEDNLHEKHRIIEKCDYLSSSKILVDRLMFINGLSTASTTTYSANAEISNYYKTMFDQHKFDILRGMITTLENKTIALVDYYNKVSAANAVNMTQNFKLLSQYSVQEMEIMKSYLGINRVCMDEKIFLQFDEFYRRLGQVQDMKFREDKQKYDTVMTQLPGQIKNFVDEVYNSMYTILDTETKKLEFSTFTSALDGSTILPLTLMDLRHAIEGENVVNVTMNESHMINLSDASLFNSKDDFKIGQINPLQGNFNSSFEKYHPDFMSGKEAYEKGSTNPLINAGKMNPQSFNPSYNPFANKDDPIAAQLTAFDMDYQNQSMGNQNQQRADGPRDAPIPDMTYGKNRIDFTQNYSKNSQSRVSYSTQHINQQNQSSSGMSVPHSANAKFGFFESASDQNKKNDAGNFFATFGLNQQQNNQTQQTTVNVPQQMNQNTQTNQTQTQIQNSTQMKTGTNGVFGDSSSVSGTSVKAQSATQSQFPLNPFQNQMSAQLNQTNRNPFESPQNTGVININTNPFGNMPQKTITQTSVTVSYQEQHDDQKDNPSGDAGRTQMIPQRDTSDNIDMDQGHDEDDIQVSNVPISTNSGKKIIQKDFTQYAKTPQVNKTVTMTQQSMPFGGGNIQMTKTETQIKSSFDKNVFGPPSNPQSQTGSKGRPLFNKAPVTTSTTQIITKEVTTTTTNQQISGQSMSQGFGQLPFGHSQSNYSFSGSKSHVRNPFASASSQNYTHGHGFMMPGISEGNEEEDFMSQSKKVRDSLGDKDFDPDNINSPLNKRNIQPTFSQTLSSKSKTKMNRTGYAIRVVERPLKDYIMAPVEKTLSIKFSEGHTGNGERTVDFGGLYTAFLDGCAYCNTSNIMYVHGGSNPITGQDSCDFVKVTYNLGKFEGTVLRKSNFPKTHHSLVCSGNDVYAIGGRGSNYCEKFVGSVCNWVQMSPMNIERESPILCVIDGYLYAIFGKDKNGRHLTNSERIELKNCTTAKWELIDPPADASPDFNYGLSNAAIFIDDRSGNIMIFGGLCTDPNSGVETFNHHTFQYNLKDNTIIKTDYYQPENHAFVENELFWNSTKYYQINTAKQTSLFEITVGYESNNISMVQSPYPEDEKIPQSEDDLLDNDGN
ncbi:MAG: hypothetical protein MJ252_08880 [archaeon]|nr:hypothetical protein [archaeon]